MEWSNWYGGREGCVDVPWLFRPRNQRPLKCGLPNCAADTPPWGGLNLPFLLGLGFVA